MKKILKFKKLILPNFNIKVDIDWSDLAELVKKEIRHDIGCPLTIKIRCCN